MAGSPVSVGARIADRYVIGGELGAGGMGVVFRARDERLGRDVAIKVLSWTAVGDDSARQRLLREARAAAGLEHPSIVHVYDVGETDDGGAFLVMELVRGKSLRDHLAAGTPSVSRRIAALVEIGRAVGFAHGRGFVHRDIKPDNVMIRDDGRAVILDFGLAKPHDKSAVAGAATLTAKGSFVGTPAYMPPEQARGEDVDGGGDQFALAVTLFEAATGVLPWRGESALEIISEILQAPPRRLREVQPDLPAALDEALSRALAKKTGDRFASMADFLDAVEGAMAQSGPASVVPVHASDVAHAATVAASVSGAASPPRAAARHPARLAIGLGLVAAAVVGGIGAGSYLRSRATPGTNRTRTAPAAPLARAGSTLACPIFVATAYDFPNTGWLGAAAAHLTCGARGYRPGSPFAFARPRRAPGPAAPCRRGLPAGDPFDSAGAREKSVAAGQSADALDRRDDRSPSGGLPCGGRAPRKRRQRDDTGGGHRRDGAAGRARGDGPSPGVGRSAAGRGVAVAALLDGRCVGRRRHGGSRPARGAAQRERGPGARRVRGGPQPPRPRTGARRLCDGSLRQQARRDDAPAARSRHGGPGAARHERVVRASLSPEDGERSRSPRRDGPRARGGRRQGAGPRCASAPRVDRSGGLVRAVGRRAGESHGAPVGRGVAARGRRARHGVAPARVHVARSARRSGLARGVVAVGGVRLREHRTCEKGRRERHGGRAPRRRHGGGRLLADLLRRGARPGGRHHAGERGGGGRAQHLAGGEGGARRGTAASRAGHGRGSAREDSGDRGRQHRGRAPRGRYD